MHWQIIYSAYAVDTFMKESVRVVHHTPIRYQTESTKRAIISFRDDTVR